MTQTRFAGSFAGITKQMLAALLPFAAAICLMLFGLAGLRVFVASLAIVPVLLVLAFAVSRMDQVAFDYQNRRWLRPLRRPLPADSISSVHLVESLGLIQAVVRTQQGSSETLLIGLPASRRLELVAAIENNSRTAQVHARRVSPLKPALVLAAVLGIPFVGAVTYFHRTSPAVSTACSTRDWPASTGHLDQAGITLSRGKRTQPAGRAGALFLQIAGLRTEYDFYQYACCSRYAIVPLLLKRVLLGDATKATFTRYHRPGNDALVIQTNSVTRILVAEPPLHLWTAQPLPAKSLKRVVGALARPSP